MKLYFKPGACSLSPHIVMRELGVPVELEKVDTKAGKTKSGADYSAINPKGAVPALQLDQGQVLTEGAVIVQYLADQKPESGLAPRPGTMERYRLQEWLNYIASDLHKGFGPLWNPKAPEDFKNATKDTLAGRLEYVQKQLGNKQFLLGDRFTVADAYLFTILTWAQPNGIDIDRWPKVKAYFDRIAARPAVKAALDAESAARSA